MWRECRKWLHECSCWLMVRWPTKFGSAAVVVVSLLWGLSVGPEPWFCCCCGCVAAVFECRKCCARNKCTENIEKQDCQYGPAVANVTTALLWIGGLWVQWCPRFPTEFVIGLIYGSHRSDANCWSDVNCSSVQMQMQNATLSWTPIRCHGNQNVVMLTKSLWRTNRRIITQMQKVVTPIY